MHEFANRTPVLRTDDENKDPVDRGADSPSTSKDGTPKSRRLLGASNDSTPKSSATNSVTPKRANSKSTPKTASKNAKSSSSPTNTPKSRKSLTASGKKGSASKRKPVKQENGVKPKLKRARLEEDSGEEDWMESDPLESEEEDVSSGDDYEPKKDESDLEESYNDDVESEGEVTTPSEDDGSGLDSPVKKTPRRAQRTPAKAPATPKTPSSSLAQSVSRNPSEWLHLSYEFLKEPKDLSGKKIGDADYDPSTLHVPNSFKNSLTPGVRQWWELKSRHFDTVLFFKVGKFYELYHMDAVIGVENLGLTYMKGDWAHSGFPEVALQRNMEALIQKGYKCARVEQTETPSMMEQRCKTSGKSSKFDKVVRREICNVSSKGLQLCGADAVPGSSYCLALFSKERRFGVCLVDSTVGRFHIGEFEDDHQLSSLRTLISRFAPVEAILERSISADVKRIVEAIGAIIDQPAKNKFLSAEKALTLIREGDYFKGNEYPQALKGLIAENDPLMSTPRAGCELAVAALASIVGRLQEALILEDVLTMVEFETIEFKFEGGKGDYLPKIMIMDSVALTNLEIFENSVGTSEGSLISTINFCSTAFGLRHLKKWLLGPSCVSEEIESRWDAVGELMENFSLLKTLQERLKKLPDMDKMLARIHSLSLKKTDHPDSRAILYSDDVYSKRKIEDFCNVLDGFREAQAICKLVRDKDLKSSLLRDLTHLTTEGGHFPDVKEALNYFDKAFDKTKALKDGKIVPAPGVDEEFDEAQRRVAEVKDSLDEHLQQQMKHFGTSKISYTGTGRTAYQIEVPESVAGKATEDHTLEGHKKGFKRYYTRRGKSLCDEMIKAEEMRDAVSKDLMRRIFHAFDEKRPLWKKVIECLSNLDCLMSLALYGNNAGGSVCRPKINHESQKAIIRIVNGCHPCLLKKLGEDKLIANDFTLGTVEEGRCDGSSVALLTGPNMGGKSTLMRQVGLLVVMAQLGAWVPAEEMEFSLVDRIFTRLGASDHITLGESTFLVEMLETSAVFKHATKHSLVLLDELGRGTSTNDGASLAYAVLAELSKSNRRTLFSTHYHDLAKDIQGVYLGHMACVVENDEDVVFLYKFVPGNCEKSFGFNVARLAGLPQRIVTMGLQRAKELEEQSDLLQRFVKFMSL
ncbi:DNA mismatch repair protein Msh6 [Galendromus occidentalis]|uniref:DNA mismatch repair protein n=1 Tax=Galendromus occidentalis TaxID=34638 RepID=A0AAJ6QS84_9ACAR|nr:DNA mismatch repair protein Msh6 [Galendromus occidentalis]